jgi:Rrf2 family protein
MRMSEGVEWAAHCCLLLDWLAEDRPVPTAKLAAGFEVPSAYLNKQLQQLVKAGILTSTPGVKGGFRLGRPLEDITMMDIVAAIEGPDEAFRCTEIRQNGPGRETPARLYKRPCAVAQSMREAELQWRRALAARTLADVKAQVEKQSPRLGDDLQRWYARV